MREKDESHSLVKKYVAREQLLVLRRCLAQMFYVIGGGCVDGLCATPH